MTGPLATRLSWAGLVVLTTTAALLRVVPVSTPSRLDAVEPLNMPQVDGAEALGSRYADAAIPVGERNPFDPEGRRWSPLRDVPEPQASPPPPPRRGAPDGIKGLFKVPGVEGVLTDDGFVSVGETVQGARVQHVGQEGAVFSVDRGSTATWVNAERNQRREAFRRLGLPLGPGPQP